MAYPTKSEWRGRWWTPGRETAALGGELRLSPDEFILTLDGLPSHLEPEVPADGVITELFAIRQEPVIWGTTRENQRLTVVDCEGHVPAIPGEVGATRWRPAAALIGEHIDAPDLTFNGIECSFRYLLAWSGGGEVEHHLDHASHRIQVAADRRLLGSVELQDGSIELLLVPRWQAGGANASIEIQAVFRVVPNGPLTWQATLDTWVGPLRDLVSLATLKPAGIEDFHLRVAGEDEERWVQLRLWLTDLMRTEPARRFLVPAEMLFTAVSLPGGFANGITRWFELHRKLAAFLAPMFAVIRAPFIHGENRFVNLAQTAESLHAVVVDGTPMDPSEYRRRADTVIALIEDPDLADWAVPILRRDNWYRFRERLADLIGRLGELGSETVAGDAAGFVSRVVRTRNALIHRTEPLDKALDQEALYRHGAALEWLLRGTLLVELGFELPDVAERVRQNPQHQFAVAELAKVIRTLEP